MNNNENNSVVSDTKNVVDIEQQNNSDKVNYKKNKVLIIILAIVSFAVVLFVILFYLANNDQSKDKNSSELSSSEIVYTLDFGNYYYKNYEENKTKNFLFNEDGTCTYSEDIYQYECNYKVDNNNIEIEFKDDYIKGINYLFKLIANNAFKSYDDYRKGGGVLFIYVEETVEVTKKSLYYFYESSSGQGYASTDSSGYYGYSQAGMYQCKNDGCIAYDAELGKAIIYDGSYFMYDYTKSAKDETLNFDFDFDFKYLRLIYNNEKTYINVTSDDYKYGLYSLESNKLIIDAIYDYISFESDIADIVFGTDYDDGVGYVFSAKTGKILATGPNGAIKKGSILYYIYTGDYDVEKIYNSSYKLILENLNLYEDDIAIDELENIVIKSDDLKQFIVYDSQGTVVRKSATYSKVYSVSNYGYAQVVDQDNNYKLVDFEDKTLANFVQLIYGMELSGWMYEDEDSSGNKMLCFDVIDPSSPYVPGQDDDDYYDAVGYQYYYIPATGLSGKNPTGMYSYDGD